MNIIKKVCAHVLFGVLLVAFGINVCAATNKSSVSASWYVGGSGNGYVDGSVNGRYYKLNKGTVRLKASCTNVSSKKQAYAKLYRKKSGFDAYYGYVNIKSTSTKTYTFPNKADKKSSEYYLVCGGGEELLNHTLTGTIYNK